MSSAARALANRQNSLHSTGPISAEGKAASSRNSYKHGLTSKQIVLPDEDPAEYDEFRQDLIDTYQPANAPERTLVEELSASSWRLMRARRQETQILARIVGESSDSDIAIAAFFMEKPKEVARLTRYISSFERAFYRAQNQLDKLQKERRGAERQAAIRTAALQMQRESLRNSGSRPVAQPASNGFVSQNQNTPENPAAFAPAKTLAAGGV